VSTLKEAKTGSSIARNHRSVTSTFFQSWSES